MVREEFTKRRGDMPGGLQKARVKADRGRDLGRKNDGAPLTTRENTSLDRPHASMIQVNRARGEDGFSRKAIHKQDDGPRGSLTKRIIFLQDAKPLPGESKKTYAALKQTLKNPQKVVRTDIQGDADILSHAKRLANTAILGIKNAGDPALAVVLTNSLKDGKGHILIEKISQLLKEKRVIEDDELQTFLRELYDVN